MIHFLNFISICGSGYLDISGNYMDKKKLLSSNQSIEVKDDKRYAIEDVDPTYFAMVFKDLPNRYVIGEDFDNRDIIIRATHLVMKLSSHDFKLPFEKRYWYKRPWLYIDMLGSSVLLFLKQEVHRLTEAYTHHRLSPTIETILDLAKEFKPKYPPDALKYVDADCIDEVVEEYNELVLKMRQVLRSKGMGERVKSYRRNATRNYNHLMSVIRSSRTRNQKILPVRLDWSEKDLDPTMPIEYLSQADFNVAALRQAQARDKMVHHLKSHFKGDLLFYAWKIEWGVQKGFHIHWFIGLNGSVYQDRINVPYHIGKHWDEVLFKGASHTHNVNAMSGRERAGLCVLHYADSQASYFFGLYADYLTKVDYNLKLRLPQNMRSFGCSKLNKRSERKTGPMRSYQMPDYDFAEVRGKRGRPTGRRFAAKTVSKGLS